MVSFLHAADVHLGIRVTRFHAEAAKKIREARFTALDNILKEARSRSVDFILIAGDLFDDHAVDTMTSQRAYEMLEAVPMPVYVLPGNHDPLLAGAVWDRPPWNRARGGRVRLFDKPEPLDGGVSVQLWPCPLTRKTSMNDPTAWIEPATTTAFIRIGVAHGSLKTRDDLPPDDHLIARYAADDKKLDYLALGHWHRRQFFASPDGADRTAYAGVPEPMRFPDSTENRTGWLPYTSGAGAEFLDAGKGEILHVRIDRPGAAPALCPVEVGHLIWQEEKHDLTAAGRLSQLINDVAVRPDKERRLLRLQLTGILDANDMLRLDELRQVLEGRYFLGEMDESDVQLKPTPEEIENLAPDGVLRRVLETLREESQSTEPGVRQLAERSLLVLYQIGREPSA